MASIVAGGVTVIVMMAVKGVLANEPIYYGLGISLVAYIVVSLATRPTDAAVLDAWRRRLAGEQPEGAAETAEPVSSGT
jgi:SSS family solute:Na+ symporter